MRATGLGRASFLLSALLSATLEVGCGSVSAVGDGSAGASGAAGTGTGFGGMDAGASGTGGTSATGGTSGAAGSGGSGAAGGAGNTEGIDSGMDVRIDSTAHALSCTTVSTATSCSPGTITEINLGQITATACNDQCQTKLAQTGVTSGCWVLAEDLNCYCRGGVLKTGGNRPGGACNQS